MCQFRLLKTFNSYSYLDWTSKFYARMKNSMYNIEYKSEMSLETHLYFIKNGFMIFDFEDNCPFVIITEMSSLYLGPIFPIVVSNFFSEHEMNVRIFKFSMMFLFTKRVNKVEMSLDITIDFDLNILRLFMMILVWVWHDDDQLILIH